LLDCSPISCFNRDLQILWFGIDRARRGRKPRDCALRLPVNLQPPTSFATMLNAIPRSWTARREPSPRVHDPLESCSRCRGIRVHHPVQTPCSIAWNSQPAYFSAEDQCAHRPDSRSGLIFLCSTLPTLTRERRQNGAWHQSRAAIHPAARLQFRRRQGLRIRGCCENWSCQVMLFLRNAPGGPCLLSPILYGSNQSLVRV
jgi:hypothetical protein